MNGSGPVLRDIHLPPAAWWPPAFGWWIVAALVVAAVCTGAWLWRRHARRGPLREALREIDALRAAHARTGDAAGYADGASRLLRRVARVVDPDVASRPGDAWRAFVRAHARDAGVRGTLDRLLDQRFRRVPAVDADGLASALRTWCRDTLRQPRPAARRFAGRRSRGAPPAGDVAEANAGTAP